MAGAGSRPASATRQERHASSHRTREPVPGDPARPSVARPVAVGRGPAGRHVPLSALEPDDVRAAVPGRAAARHLQLQAGGGERRAGRQGDQRPQPLHRHEGPGRPRTSPSSSGCRSSSAALGLLFLRAAVHGTMSRPGRRRSCSTSTSRRSRSGRSATSCTATVTRLAPTAAVKVPPFMPPMFGYKQLANFEVYSYPHARLVRARPRPGRAAARAVPGTPRRACPARPWCARDRDGAAGRRVPGGPGTRRRARRVAGSARSTAVRCAALAAPARIDASPPGATVEVGPGTYAGDLVIDRPVRLVGRGRPLLVGSGAGSVVRVRADDVTIEGFDIDGRDGGDLGRDSSGDPRRRPARDGPRLPRSRLAVRRSTSARRTAAGSSGAASTGFPGRDPGEKRAPASTSGTPTASV